MKTRARYTRMLLCALLLLSSFVILFLQQIPAASPGREDEAGRTTTTTTVTMNYTTTRNSTTIVTMNYTTTRNSIPLIPYVIDIASQTIPPVILGLVTITVALLACALILRSRSLRALDELDGQRRLVYELRQPGIAAPATGMSASSALKRLLELGVLQPKEYMEKKILAERIENKMSAKQLLDEGLISQEQYDALTRKQE